MRIHLISTAPRSGGAARAAVRLHLGLMREPGVESLLIDLGDGARGSGVLPLAPRRSRDSLFRRLKRRKWGQIVSRQFASTTPPASNPIGWGDIEMLKLLPVPDVWNLHWVSWFLDWQTMLPWMAERAPIVWTLHDLNPLMGIWHYEPLPEERTRERMSYESLAVELKRDALARIPKDRLTFVGPSRWMVEECRKSPVTKGFKVEHIPNGLDTKVFTPRDSILLRRMFGISEEAKVIGFIADNINDPRKGVQSLLEALRRLKGEIQNLHLVTVGNGEVSCEGIGHTALGPILNDQILSFFYSACDIFVCPSLQDNLPNTVMESLACGTPVAAYNVGGLPDMVHSGMGSLADPSGGASSFERSLKDCLRSQISRDSIRHHAESRYSLRRQALEYLSLYKSHFEVGGA